MKLPKLITLFPIALLAATACDAGSTGGAGVADKLPICEGWYDIVGTHNQQNSGDADADSAGGCKPFGSYNFTVTYRPDGNPFPDPELPAIEACDPSILPPSQDYVVNVTPVQPQGQGAITQDITFSTDPGGVYTYGKVQRDGTECAGEFTEIHQDGKGIFKLRPYTPGVEIEGTGYFALFAEDQNLLDDDF